MQAKFFQYWDSLRSSYWFVPTCMAVVAVTLAFASLAIDEALDRQALSGLSLVYTGGPQGARGVLSTVAGSMITVAGVVFSITIVVLSLTSQQFGPRLLRNFMKDQSTQVVLGTFVATFLYAILVLRAVRGDNFDQFVPHISVTIAVALALASVGVLIYFIHHISVSVQVDHVVGTAYAELRATLDRLFPAEIGDDPAGGETPSAEAEAAACCAGKSTPVACPQEGYVQGIDSQAILAVAAEHQWVVKLVAAPGDYVLKGQPLALVWQAQDSNGASCERLGRVFVIGSARTTRQDSRYAVRQLVEVALRALSPGINDPFTAISCLDRLAAALSLLARRRVPSPYRYDDDGRLRVIAEPDTFAAIARAAFVEIRYFGRNNVTVMCHLLESLGRIGGNTTRASDREYLRRLNEAVHDEALAGLTQDDDRRAIDAAFERSRKVLDRRADG